MIKPEQIQEMKAEAFDEYKRFHALWEKSQSHYDNAICSYLEGRFEALNDVLEGE